jgi:D-glycero-alpha-D-manno-heptose 1-phosphate guanylyltransferase
VRSNLEAIILAGGFGTRLQKVVRDVPKPLAPVAGRPFLAYLLDSLSHAGVKRAVLATGYLSEQIEAAMGHAWRGMALAYSVEDTPLGTGGAIQKALSKTSGGPVLVLNGDTWLRFSATEFAAAVQASGQPLGMALARVPDVARYGAVALSGECITDFGEKNSSGPGFINAGVYCMADPARLSFPAMKAFSFEKEILAPAGSAGHLFGFIHTSDFIDIGVPEDYARAQDEAKGWLA